jgi:DNA-binding transcriptional ArsR family regulator
MSTPDPDLLNAHTMLDQMVIDDPDVVPILFHVERQKILLSLIQEEKTIQDLRTELQLNPGTIKRHLLALTNCGLVRLSRMVVNPYGIRMKYYRAVARQYIVSLRWPAKEE